GTLDVYRSSGDQQPVQGDGASRLALGLLLGRRQGLAVKGEGVGLVAFAVEQVHDGPPAVGGAYRDVLAPVQRDAELLAVDLAVEDLEVGLRPLVADLVPQRQRRRDALGTRLLRGSTRTV